MGEEFRVLGGIEIQADGHRLDLGPARQQRVLAVLLIEANQVVTVDQLTYRVWGERAPQRARSTLYSYLSRLRQALRTAAGEAQITRRSGGYELSVALSAVDLHRFRDLAARARTTAYEGDEDNAARLFDEALALWRGDVCPGMDTPWFNAQRETTRVERLAAVLDWGEIQLRRGLHAELLTTLPVHAESHPLDERLTAQLMLALYRGGRPADALNCYQELRRRLADDLGIDPGPPLQELYQQILVSDPRLAAPARGAKPNPARTAAARPRQLPAPPPLFTGRGDDLAGLDKLLAPQSTPGSVPIAAICGTGGVGKTWLALRWAHDQQEYFPDGQLYADLRGFTPSGEPMDPYAVMRGFLEALGTDPANLPTAPQSQAALYRSLTAGQRLLIVLDNARDSDHVEPLLPGSPTCAVLITSRHQLPGLAASHGAGQLTLQTLDISEARALLVRRLGADPLDAEPAAAAELLQHSAGLPLAISVLAARLTTNPVLTLSALAAELRDTATRLDALESGEATSDVRTVFASSYLALDPQSARLFRQLAQAPGADIGLSAAASLTALPLSQLRTRLRRLQAHHLIQEHVPGRFTCHDLLRAYALELAETVAPATEADAALTRVLDHYAHTAYAADRLLLPHRDPLRPATAAEGTHPEEFATHDQAMTWFAAEHTVLTATVDHAVWTGRNTQAWRLAWAMTTFLTRRGRWADVTAVHTTALAAAVRLGDTAAQADSHRTLAWAYTETARFAEAHHELAHALALSETSGNLLAAAHTHLALGWLYERQGDKPAALRHDQSAVDLFTSLRNLPGQARALNAVAWDHAQLGDHTASVRRCQEALAIQEELGDDRGQASTWDTLGYAYHQLGEHAKALDCYERSLNLNRALSHRYNEAETLVHLSQTHRAMGACQEARAALRQALALYLDIQAPDADVQQVRKLLYELDTPPVPGGLDDAAP
ncbi:tetratricopeptide repeat protein [Streptomyces sp. KM273126]|uniref:AfsR/SARP family transcriptional regulator n=1 Tax=Streptomyces sp. KM273126 TaxID=2545247 RepID=UPI001039398A|nr:BTAD domain-containing putative transcriptional regulator [Streptomyces sp. KM273126]MBA2813865.1 tetratricopeptide repeat protein [Streptomyces sp. KM273126]